MVFPGNDYDGSALAESGDNLVFTHNALGAEKLRYSVNFGKNWTSWKDWEDTTTIPKSTFANKEYFWQGNHVIMNCEFGPIPCIECPVIEGPAPRLVQGRELSLHRRAF
jgi:hypothetical protein